MVFAVRVAITRIFPTSIHNKNWVGEMATWKTNYPNRNLGPNRRINDDLVGGGAVVDGTMILVASYRKAATQALPGTDFGSPALIYNTLTWDATDMPAPYSVLSQPFATLSGGTDVTVDVDGVYLIYVNVTVISNVLELNPDFNVYIFKDDGVTPVCLAVSSPARFFAEVPGYTIGGTATAHTRLSAGDSIYIQEQSNTARSTVANYGTTLTIFKVAD
jgi:hypothetical protein